MRDAKKGTYNGDYTCCPVNAYGDCPYCDQMGICHIDDPQEDCDDWGAVWESWEDWLAADDIDHDTPEDFAEDEIRWAGDVYGYDDEMFDHSYEEAEKDML